MDSLRCSVSEPKLTIRPAQREELRRKAAITDSESTSPSRTSRVVITVTSLGVAVIESRRHREPASSGGASSPKAIEEIVEPGIKSYSVQKNQSGNTRI